MAVGAFGVHGRQEEELDHHRSLALAGRAAPAGDIEGESARLVPTGTSFRGVCESTTHVIEQPGIGGDVRPRGPADGPLVDDDQPLYTGDGPGDAPLEMFRRIREE